MAGAASPRKRASLFDLLSARTTARKGPRTLWTASTPAFLSRLHVSETLEEHDGCVNTICWNSSGSLLVSGCVAARHPNHAYFPLSEHA
eukprot:1309472-Prymnesium_polylepis.1